MSTQTHPNQTQPLRVLDLFAGAGGLGLGLTHAGMNIIVANEYEPVFSETYALNHPETHVICGDILNKAIRTKILNAAEGVDVVAGGPPCQGFSTVGSKNESDPRNQLFYAFLEIVSELRPRAVLFENVSGFRRMYQARAFNALRNGLENLNYSAPDEYCQILNALHFGLPQQRLRTFVVAFREPTIFRFPEPTHSQKADLFSTSNALTIEQALSDLPLIPMGGSSTNYLHPPKNAYQRMMRAGVSDNQLTEHIGPNHGEKLMRMIQYVPTGGTIADIPEALRPRAYFANTYSRLWWDRPATTITRNFGTPSSSRCIHPLVDRGLTTREGARLQGFPDSYHFTGTRTEKNLQIGNAVPPPLGQAIGLAIVNALKKSVNYTTDAFNHAKQPTETTEP